MFDLEFRDPWFLLTATAAFVVYHLTINRTAGRVTYSTLSLFDHTPRTWRARLANLPSWLLACAALLLAIALAGPRTPDVEARIRREGIAIVMVVDRSGTMQARDLVPSDVSIDRLQVVKELFKQFVLGKDAGLMASEELGRGRPDDLIGLVAFARFADGLCPLTLDHGNLVNIVDDLQIVTDPNEDGTALGEGLALAVERLRRHSARSKLAILLTDGVNNAGDISPEEAAELAHAHNVKVYCIGTGTTGLAPVPAIDPFTGRTVLRRYQVEIDEKILRDIANTTGGFYFRATDAKALAEVYANIDRLERSEIVELRYFQYQEWYGYFALAALAMIASGGLLGGTLFRRLP